MIKPTKARPDRLFSSFPQFFLLLLLVLTLTLAACGDSPQNLTLTTTTAGVTVTTPPAANTTPPATTIAASQTTAPVATTSGPAPANTVVAITPTPARSLVTPTAPNSFTSTPQKTIANPLTIEAKNPTTPTAIPPFSLPPSPAAVTPIGPIKDVLGQLDATSYGTIAYEANGDIWMMILPEGIQRNLTGDGSTTMAAFQEGFNRNPVWSPGSVSIAYASPADASKEAGYASGYDVYTIRPDGSNRARITKDADSLYVQRFPVGWASSTEIIISQRDTKNPQSGLAPLAILDTATGKTRDLPVKQTGITKFAVSPDGSTIAYAAPTTDAATSIVKADVFVIPAAGGDPKALTDLPAEANLGVTALSWSPDSKNVAFVRAVGNGTTCGPYAVYTVGKDGQNLKKVQFANGFPQTVSYSLSGAWLTFSSNNCSNISTLNVINAQKGGLALELGTGSNPTFGKRIIA